MPSPVHTDPRIDPRFRANFGDSWDDAREVLGDKLFATREECLEHSRAQVAKALQNGLQAPAPKIPQEVRALWAKDGLDVATRSFTSKPDGNEVKLQIARPASASGLPLVYWIHGGGMAMGSAFDPGEKAVARVLAREGVVVACVDFRNSEIPSMSNQDVAPFPAGLNDCYSGLLWCLEHAAELGVDPKKIVVAGISGGGNLCISTVLKAKEEGQLGMISGFYALCPFIAGTWPADAANEGILGQSHITNHEFMPLGGTRDMSNSALGYGAEAFRAKNPLAWPGFAQPEELRGLPRCVISVNECDPLRDEGVNFYRRLLQANVPARCRDVIGTPHGGDLMFNCVPDLALGTLRDITDFAKQVGSGFVSRL